MWMYKTKKNSSTWNSVPKTSSFTNKVFNIGEYIYIKPYTLGNIYL